MFETFTRGIMIGPGWAEAYPGPVQLETLDHIQIISLTWAVQSGQPKWAFYELYELSINCLDKLSLIRSWPGIGLSTT